MYLDLEEHYKYDVLLVSAAVWALLEDLLHRGGGGGQRVGPLQTLQPDLVPPEHQPQLGTSPPRASPVGQLRGVVVGHGVVAAALVPAPPRHQVRLQRVPLVSPGVVRHREPSEPSAQSQVSQLRRRPLLGPSSGCYLCFHIEDNIKTLC